MHKYGVVSAMIGIVLCILINAYFYYVICNYIKSHPDDQLQKENAKSPDADQEPLNTSQPPQSQGRFPG